MKALTIRQPWASLIALGAKTIETRVWQTHHRGRVAIHAGRHVPKPSELLILLSDSSRADEAWRRAGLASDEHLNPGPLGAIVATAELIDCAPIGGPYTFRTGVVDGDEGDWPDRFVLVRQPAMLHRPESLILDSPGGATTDVSDQLPLGHYEPGMWGWLLADVKPTSERCPLCWGVGRAERPARAMVGSKPGGVVVECPACKGDGACDPVPATGGQGLWTWRP